MQKSLKDDLFLVRVNLFNIYLRVLSKIIIVVVAYSKIVIFEYANLINSVEIVSI